MLRLQKCILTQLLQSTSASPLHRFISAAAPAVSPSPCFTVEEYLVSTCGLTRPQAAKASAKISHLKSPTNPVAVLAFLAGIGLSPADVTTLVARDPKFLCAGVERTLSPAVAGLTGLGLSRPQIVRLVLLAGEYFRRRSVASKLPYLLSLFGSYDNLLRVLKHSPSLLGCDPDRVVKPNIALLHECGLSACDIAKLCVRVPWLLCNNLERVRTMTACAQRLGVPRGSPMFRHALEAVAFFDEEKVAAKVEVLKTTSGWSDAEVGIAVSKAPLVLTKTKESLQRRSEFLISEVGLGPTYIAYRPVILLYSLEGWLRPRYYVVKFLKENGLLDHDRDYYAAVMTTQKVFTRNSYPLTRMLRHTSPKTMQQLAPCRGEVPPRFISFTHMNRD